MTRSLPALLFAVVALAACRADPPAPESPPAAVPVATLVRRPPPSTPFDAADTTFDTVEPPEQTVQFPPRPEPRPEPRTPPPPPPRDSAGSCDVRATEGFCFTYTGEGWTPAAARDQCTAAPNASFDSGTCPREGRIATCTFERPSAPGREIVYTYYEPYDPALAELACPGTFARTDGGAP